MTVPLVDVRDLSIAFPLPDGGALRAVRHVSFQIAAGECLGLVGESGSGKSLSALAMAGLLPRRAIRTAEHIRFRSQDLTGAAGQRVAEQIRGRQIGFIFQEPMTSLNPVYTVGRQLTEVMLHHRLGDQVAARRRAIELLERVGVSNPENRLRQYPHELSGGQRQRVMIAMALMNKPELLIADEPTTALDVTVQAQIVELLSELQREMGLALLLITHNLGLVARVADRIAVMYAGEVVETARRDDLFSTPSHPYTQGLLRATPDGAGHGPGTRLGTIPGTVPSITSELSACVFAPRCHHVRDACRNGVPQLNRAGDNLDHIYRCVLSSPPQIPGENAHEPLQLRQGAGEKALVTSRLSKTYHVGRGLFARSRPLTALREVDLDVSPGETLAIVGESGCGKSTLARLLVGLEEPSAGAVEVVGGGRNRARMVQLVFQDPYSSLNPSFSVRQLVRRPLDIHGLGSDEERDAKVSALLDQIGMPQHLHDAGPGELSGGQRQRVAIARALILEPQLIICDEPTSALDVSVQAQILNLLSDLRDRTGVAFVFITHDLGVVSHMADRIAVMYLGEIVEIGRARDVLEHPRHPYTRALIAATPRIGGPRIDWRATIGPGLANPLDRPTGCAFRNRCLHADEDCARTQPKLRRDPASGTEVRCLRYETLPPFTTGSRVDAA
jgi:peptide/nickel transport system ATP-binding protein